MQYILLVAILQATVPKKKKGEWGGERRKILPLEAGSGEGTGRKLGTHY